MFHGFKGIKGFDLERVTCIVSLRISQFLTILVYNCVHCCLFCSTLSSQALERECHASIIAPSDNADHQRCHPGDGYSGCQCQLQCRSSRYLRVLEFTFWRYYRAQPKSIIHETLYNVEFCPSFLSPGSPPLLTKRQTRGRLALSIFMLTEDVTYCRTNMAHNRR